MYSRLFDILQNSLVTNYYALVIGNMHKQDRTDIALRLRLRTYIEDHVNRK